MMASTVQVLYNTHRWSFCHETLTRLASPFPLGSTAEEKEGTPRVGARGGAENATPDHPTRRVLLATTCCCYISCSSFRFVVFCLLLNHGL